MNYHQRSVWTRRVASLLIGFAVTMILSGCYSEQYPTGPPAETCDNLLPGWYRLLPIGTERPADFKLWMLDNDLIQATEELSDFQEGVVDPVENGGQGQVSVERWLVFTTDQSEKVLTFDTEGHLKKADFTWQRTAPTLDLTLECLGPPQYYEAHIANVEAASLVVQQSSITG